MALITQRQAIKRLREIGLSEATATEKVKKIVKASGIKDGMRTKLRRCDVELVIAEYEQPLPAAKTGGIKPFSPAKKARIRAFGLPIRQRI